MDLCRSLDSLRAQKLDSKIHFLNLKCSDTLLTRINVNLFLAEFSTTSRTSLVHRRRRSPTLGKSRPSNPTASTRWLPTRQCRATRQSISITSSDPKSNYFSWATKAIHRAPIKMPSKEPEEELRRSRGRRTVDPTNSKQRPTN